MIDDGTLLYVDVDVHEEESQLAILEGSYLLMEERLPMKGLEKVPLVPVGYRGYGEVQARWDA